MGKNYFIKDDVTTEKIESAIYFYKNSIEENAELVFEYFLLSKNFVFKGIKVKQNGKLSFEHTEFTGDARYYFSINPHKRSDDEIVEQLSDKTGTLSFTHCVMTTPVRIVRSNLYKLEIDPFTLNSSIDKLLLDEGEKIKEEGKAETSFVTYEPTNKENQRIFYNILKYHAEKRNDKISALKYYAKEMNAHFFEVVTSRIKKQEQKKIIFYILTPILVTVATLIVILDHISPNHITDGQKIANGGIQVVIILFTIWFLRSRYFDSIVDKITLRTNAIKIPFWVPLVICLILILLAILLEEPLTIIMLVCLLIHIMVVIIGQDGLVLILNRISNRFGLSWLRALLFLLLGTFCFLVPIRIFTMYDRKMFSWDLVCSSDTWSIYLKMLNPLHILSPDEIFGTCLSLPTKVLIFCSQVFVSFAIYQLVAAFRKFKK